MSRIRSTPAFLPVGATGSQWGPGITDVNYGSGNWTHSWSDSMTDEVTPGYFAKKKSGQVLPVNQLNQTKYSIEASNDYCLQQYWNSGQSPTLRATLEFQGNLASCAMASAFNTSVPAWYSNWATNPSWPSTTAVLQEALAKANASKFDLLTFLAEFNKTNELVRRFGKSTFKRAYDLNQSLQKRVRRSQMTYKVFSEAWLEARYGWRILMYDLLAMNESIERLQEGIPLRGRFSAYDEIVGTPYSSSGSATTLRAWSPNLTGYNSYFNNVAYSRHQTVTRSVKAGVAVEHLGQDMYMSDPLVTAWEIIPFSFIADWFLTIGDAIKAHSPFATTNLLWSYLTTVDKRTTTLTASFDYSTTCYSAVSADSWTGNSISESVCVSEKSVRLRTAQAPTVALEFDLNFDYKKAIDLVALGGIFGKILGGSFNVLKTPLRL